MEIFLWGLGASYVMASLFALAGCLNNRHVLTRGVWVVRVVLEAAIWPSEELWLQLRQFFSRLNAAAVPRYQGVGS
jgi:hypothetical protein